MLSRFPSTTPRCTGALLRHLARHVKIGAALPTDVTMEELGGSSRTAVRSALAYFVERGPVAGMKERFLPRRAQRASAPAREVKSDFDLGTQFDDPVAQNAAGQASRPGYPLRAREMAMDVATPALYA